MKKALMLSLYALVILGCVFSATFEMYQPVDDFGDPVGEKIVKSKDLYGTYKTASVQDGKMSYTIAIQNGGVIQIRMALGIFEIGDRGPAGGWIFYDCDEDNSTGNADGLISSECGWRYLEAAPLEIGGYKSYGFGYYRPDGTNNNMVGTSQSIGSGRYNTEMLVEYMDIDGEAYSDSSGTATEEYAAKKCLDYSFGGYDDWFLPSKEELNMMYNNLMKKGLGWFFHVGYWSSSENNSSSAWGQHFHAGNQIPNKLYVNNYVRAVRAF